MNERKIILHKEEMQYIHFVFDYIRSDFIKKKPPLGSFIYKPS